MKVNGFNEVANCINGHLSEVAEVRRSAEERRLLGLEELRVRRAEVQHRKTHGSTPSTSLVATGYTPSADIVTGRLVACL